MSSVTGYQKETSNKLVTMVGYNKIIQACFRSHKSVVAVFGFLMYYRFIHITIQKYLFFNLCFQL